MTIIPGTPRLRLLLAFGLAVFAVVAYARAQSLPFFADDYVQVDLARGFSNAGWTTLLSDALYRSRATSLLLTRATEHVFGFSVAAFNASSLSIHVFNVWLVALLGIWRPIGWKISIPAAAFFAIAEGHQEAVIWYAALPELLVFTFILASFLCWIFWLQSESSSWTAYAASYALFVVALFSKESAVCLVGLQSLAVLIDKRPGRLAFILPFALTSAVYFLSIYAARSNHLHFNDGTFVLSAPFWVTLPNTIVRMLWIWGFAGLGILCFFGIRRWRPFLLIVGGWAVCTLLPYSFLSYMSRVPSRHTYLASVALALIVAAAFTVFRERGRRGLALALASAILIQNCAYLWTRKHEQYVQRAAPTRDLIELARSTTGDIYVHCFPYSPIVAELALDMEVSLSRRLVFANPSECEGHRYTVGVSLKNIAQSRP